MTKSKPKRRRSTMDKDMLQIIQEAINLKAGIQPPEKKADEPVEADEDARLKRQIWQDLLEAQEGN
jgi:hypothetical protein